MSDQILDLVYRLEMLGVSVFFMGIFLAGLAGLAYLAFLLWKFRNREEHSLDYVLVQVAVPRDNEIKIDAAEQLFASLHSIQHGGFWSFLKPQEHVSFEIVAKSEDIRFYVSTPRKLM